MHTSSNNRPIAPTPPHRCEWDDCRLAGLPCGLVLSGAHVPPFYVGLRLCPDHAVELTHLLERVRAFDQMVLILTEMIAGDSGQPAEVVEMAITRRLSA